MKFVFLMDPLETVVFEKDTTFALMLGAKARGHDVYFLPRHGITLKNGQVVLHVTHVVPQRVKSKPFVLKKNIDLPADKVDVVFVRTDPPFDDEYLMHTWLLDRLPSTVAVINRASGIRTVNEKVWATQFTALVPPTLISRNRSELLTFIKHEKSVVAKPTNGHGGRAIFRINSGDSNTNVVLETLSAKFTTEIILQRYIPAASKGDKRILLLNGDPLGAVLRVHSEDDHRNNFFSGGRAFPAKITKRDCEVIDALRPRLRELGLYFVGIDMLGNYLTEVNVTSPTCLQEINKFSGKKLENDVIVFAERLVNEKQAR
ncbi:MAG: glutathione synthase [Candidatus Omnitrophica bacterium]|nr:glutathione synthase [Candidatus Omnitrophota bacterium]